MSIEEYNIHALMSLGSEINKKDKLGDSVLHVALARFIDDQDNYGLYKEVIKSILQFGAHRDLRNNQNLTPIELLHQYKDRIIL
jgi:ankyrin repeat protein